MADPLDTPLMWVPQELVSCLHTPGYPSSGCAKRGCTVHTSDWRAKPGSAENLHRVRGERILTIGDLPGRRFNTAALVSGYVITRDGEPLATTPRVTKESLPWVREQGLRVTQTCLIADVDTMPHVPWTPESMADFEATWATAPSLRTCGLYLSQRGYRLLQPLSTWLDVEEAEPRYHAWLHQLVAEGVWASALECKDFGHLMRVPHYRDAAGARILSPRIDFSRMVPVEPPAAVPRSRSAPRRRTNRQPAPGGGAVIPLFVDAAPEDWQSVADALGAAIRDHVRSGWRRCNLALSGALAERGCALEAIPAVVGRAHAIDQSYPEWEERLGDRVELARSTAIRYASGETVLGYGALAAEFPGVAAALDAATTSGLEASVLAQLRRPGPARMTAAAALDIIRREIAEAYGVTCIAAPPGTGKTRAIVEHSDNLPAIVERAAPGSRIVLSVPRHDLALQVVGQRPDRALRLFSPVSHVGPKGEPSCIYVEAARAFANGGQSVRREFCEGRGKEPCSERERCPAYAGQEGAEHANLVVGVHGLARQLRGYAGAAGTLVVDEPGEAVFSERVTLDQLATAARYLDQFQPSFAEAMTPALEAFTTWLSARATATGEPEYVSEAIARCAPEGAGDEVLQAVASAIAPSARTQSPPLRWSAVAIARSNPARAHELGEASRVFSLLYRAITRAVPYAVVLEEVGEARVATFVGLNDDLALALRHEGPVVILDADVMLHLPAITKVLGHAPRVVQLDVLDGAPIARTILVTRATHSAWMPHGVPDWNVILPSLRAVVAWILEDTSTRRIGLIAPKTIEAAIAHTLAPEAPGPRKAWSQAGQSAKSLARARELLAPILSAVPGQILTGHYQALEGLDFMADCDATVTLMDCRPNLGDQAARAAYLGLSCDGRCDDLAVAELGQAHGRLRTIHRTCPGRQLHVGALVPGGWQGYPVDVRRLPVGRPRTVAAMTAADFSAARAATGMGLRELGRALKVSDGTLRRYESGERAIPEATAVALRALAPGAPETPFRDIPLLGVSGAPSEIRAQSPAKGVSGAPIAGHAKGVSGAPDDDGPRRARRIDLAALLDGPRRRQGGGR
ncbi:MAG: helix-turn-helix transcriptional regulator [Deltaproteobacteria bacterium]|nr:helix-turn-helix transcriptional regulator [Myxococcales bacterium]MDP3219723.1 helix-turn-helix transcriptional regulator [Deltaproteobacteria bacterium]